MSKSHSNTMQRSASLSCLREEYKYVAAIVNPLSGERAASDYVYQSLCQELGHHRVLRLTKEVFADTRPIKNLILEFATIRVDEGEVGSDGVRRHRHRLPSTRQSTSPSRRAMSTAPATTATDSSTPLLGASADPNGAADWGSVATEAAKNNNTTQAAGSREELPVVHGDDLYESATTTTAQSKKNKDFSRNASSSSTSQPITGGNIDQLTPCSPDSSSSSQLPRGIVIVAGGDGTVSFVMQVLDQLSAELIAKEEQECEDILEAEQQSEATTQVELTQKSAQPDPPLKTEDGTIDLTESESEDSTARQATPGPGGEEEEDLLRPSNHQLISSPLSDSAPPAMMMIGASSDAEEPSFTLPAPATTTTRTVSSTPTTAAATTTQEQQHTVVRNISSSLPTLPAVAVIAMGTGNDLSNWLGFGLGYTKYKCQPFGACCCCMASCSGKHANSGRPRNCCVNSVEDAVASLVTAMTQQHTHNSKTPQQQQQIDTSTNNNSSCRVVQFDRWSTRVVPLSVVYTAVCALRSAGLSSSRGGGDDDGANNNTNAASTLSSASSCPHLLRLQSLSDMSMDLTTTDSTTGGAAAPPSPPTKEMLLKGLEKLVNKNYTHIAMNYFSFGMDAFIATTFDQLRKAYPGIFQYRLVNKMVYGNLGVYGWQKCKRLDPYIKALEVGVNTTTTTSSTSLSSAQHQPHPQHLKSATFPAKTKAFVAANVGSYSGGVKLWDPDSSVAKNKYLIGSSTKNKPSSSRVTAPLVTGASVSDCRLEVQGVGGMVEMGLLQLKVTSADKVAQTSTMRTVLGMPKALPASASASKSGKKTGDKYREIGVPIVATRDPEVSLEELTAVLPTIVAMEITDELLIAVRTQLNHYYRRDSPNLPAPTPKFNPPIAFQVDGEPSGTIPEPSIVEISPYNKPMFVIARNGKQI